MAIGEVAVKDATLLAISEINQAGGVLGCPLHPIVRDGASDIQTFAAAAKHLLCVEQAAVVFGCWTSASRKAVLPIFERERGLLFYPLQYEGFEQSPNIIYTGATPSQQIIPAVDYLLSRGKRKLFLIGSDYIFPKTAHRIIKARLVASGDEWVGEEYIPLGSMEMGSAIAHILAAEPDAIFNTLNGDSNQAFFQTLQQVGISPDRMPVLSVSLAEEEVRRIGPQKLAGHWLAWSYFQTLDTPENQKFIGAYKAAYGEHRVTDDPIEAAYLSVYLWKNAVEKAGSTQIDLVKVAVKNLDTIAPGGRVKLDGHTQHLWKMARIGQIQSDGSIQQIWASETLIPPDPFLKTYPWAASLTPKGFVGEIRLFLMGLSIALTSLVAIAIGVGLHNTLQLEQEINPLGGVPFNVKAETDVRAKAKLAVVNRTQILLLGIFVLSLILLPISLLVVFRITRALSEVSQSAQLLASGDFNARSPIVSGDEIGVLSATLNTMAQQVNCLLSSVEVRSRQLTIAKEAAETANETKTQFLTNMSHELRTPLNAIIGYSELMQEDAKVLGEEFVRDLQTINQSGRHLLSLIEDVLDISKIEAGTMTLRLETFEVKAAIDEVVMTIAPLVGDNDNTLIVNCERGLGAMYADSRKVKQILLNLLSNAAKFTKRGKILLDVRRQHSNAIAGLPAGIPAECLVFSIADTGIGIDLDRHLNLFEAFTQVDPSISRQYGGMGVGLAICQQLCQLMGGTISVESRLGAGSTFTVSLPSTVNS
jgi:urea transport system substrate-binding protein